MFVNGLSYDFLSKNGIDSLINKTRVTRLIDYINSNLSLVKGFRDYNIRTSVINDTAELATSLMRLTDGTRKLDSTGAGVQYVAMASMGILNYIMGICSSKSVKFEERVFTDETGKKILPVVFAIDEPEVHLHPYLQRSLIKYYQNILRNKDKDFTKLLQDCFGIDRICGQIIVVTHSTDILIGNYRNIIRFYKDKKTVRAVCGSSKAVSLTKPDEKHLLLHFPEIKEAFYSRCTIIVEGETEYGCIPGFAETMEIPLDELGICIINANGAGTIKYLANLLKKFKIPCVLIYDGDVKKSKQKNKNVYYTNKLCFEPEIVYHLFNIKRQDKLRDIVTEYDDKALKELLDEDFVKEYYRKAGIALNGYVAKRLYEVQDNDENDFCNLFSAWMIKKKEILLGRIIGKSLSSVELIPDCYQYALKRAQEIVLSAE